MGRVGNILSGVAKSSLSLGPLDAVFAGLDYADGKAQGEDDLRAVAGAAGSTGGGLAGAMAGGAAGAAIGSVIPFAGTAVGGAIGAIAGGMAGSFGGGWGADRVDEAVRGNQGARESERNNERNLATTGGVGVGAVATGVLAKNMNADDLRYQQALAQKRGINLNNTQAAGAALKSSGGAALRSTLNTAKQLPLKQMGIGGALIAGGAAVNNMMSNPIGGAIDALTGNAMNLRSDDPTDYERQREAGRYNPSTAAYNALNDVDRAAQNYDNRADFLYERGKADQLQMMDLAHNKRMEYERDADARKYNYDLGRNQQQLDAQREISFAGLQADQAKNQLDLYSRAGADATNQLSAILGARYF